jgi:hypothetical protein
VASSGSFNSGSECKDDRRLCLQYITAATAIKSATATTEQTTMAAMAPPDSAEFDVVTPSRLLAEEGFGVPFARPFFERPLMASEFAFPCHLEWPLEGDLEGALECPLEWENPLECPLEWEYPLE